MTGSELDAILHKLGMTRKQFAEVIGKTWRTVQRWCHEEIDKRSDRPRRPIPVPHYAAMTANRLLVEKQRRDRRRAREEASQPGQ
jgi:hypothetical protein